MAGLVLQGCTARYNQEFMGIDKLEQLIVDFLKR
jgi:hypothetical protein